MCRGAKGSIHVKINALLSLNGSKSCLSVLKGEAVVKAAFVTKGDEFGEMRGVYPDAHMIDDIGDAPAYALWAHHVRGLQLTDYEVLPTGADPRPTYAFLFEDMPYIQT